MKAQHLERLAELHDNMVHLMETRLTALRARIMELDRSKTGMMQAIERTSSSGIGLYGGTTRRLADIEAARKAAAEAMDELERRLMSARSRRDILMRRSIGERVAHERRETDEITREIALQMKATGKHRVMK